MSLVKTMTMRTAPVRGSDLRRSFSDKLTALVRTVSTKVDSGTVMMPDEAEALAEKMRALATEARDADAGPAPVLFPSAAIEALEALAQAETILATARKALITDMRHPDRFPQDARVVRLLRNGICDANRAVAILSNRPGLPS